MLRETYEIPVTSATALDTVLSVGGGKNRVRDLRRGSDWGEKEFSLGRYGKVRLAAIPIVPYLGTACKWNKQVATTMRESYERAGLWDLLESRVYKETIEATTDTVRELIKGVPSPQTKVATVVDALKQLLSNGNESVKAVTLEMLRINQKVDEELDAFRRFEGYVARVGDAESIVVIDEGEREVLKRVNSQALKNLGVYEVGEPFVMHQLTWTPDVDNPLSFYVPAVSKTDEGELEDLRTWLDENDESLPHLDL